MPRFRLYKEAPAMMQLHLKLKYEPPNRVVICLTFPTTGGHRDEPLFCELHEQRPNLGPGARLYHLGVLYKTEAGHAAEDLVRYMALDGSL